MNSDPDVRMLRQRVVDLEARLSVALQQDQVLRASFEAMREGLCLQELVFDAGGRPVDYRILDVNPAYERITGISRRRAIGSLGSELYGSGEPPYLDLWAPVALTGTPMSFETYFPPMDKYFSISVFCPGPNRFGTIFTDITDRKRAEDALRQSEERYRNLYTNTPAMLHSIDAAGRLISVSDYWLQNLGYSRDEVIGRRTVEFLTEESRRYAEKTVLPIFFSTGVLRDIPYQWVKKNGEVMDVLLSATAEKDESGRVIRSVAVMVDVTEQKKAEEALRASERLYTSLVETAQDLVWRCDEQGRYVYLNQAWEHVFGYALTEMLGRPFSDFMDEASAKMDLREFARLLGEKGSVYNYETVHRHRDGHPIHLIFNARAIVDDSGRAIGTQGTALDITERKKAEEERLDLERRLLHAQKLESLGVLAGGIAHDFNNLLLAVLGNLDLALKDLPSDSKTRERLEDAARAAHRAADLTGQMLAYSGRGKFIVTQVNLTDLVEENAHILKASIAKTATLHLTLAQNLPTIRADRAQMQQVVMNLITNASEALGDRPGLILLTTGVQDYDEAALGRSYLEEKPEAGTFAYLQVTDTGCGMDETTLQRLFEPFFTTKFTGRGLGMSAVLGIVRGHGGAIFIDSREGQGTTIRIAFPASQQEGTVAEIAAGSGMLAAVGAPRSLQGTVLIVDDEDIVLDTTRGIVEFLGLKALTAADGKQAIEIFSKSWKEIDCVILDYSMPRMDGLAAFRELLKIRPDVTVVLASGFDEQEAIQRFSEGRPAGFIQKPFTVNALRDVLWKALSRT